MCRLATPWPVDQFHHLPTTSVLDVSKCMIYILPMSLKESGHVENLCSAEVYQSSPKSLKTCYVSMPIIVQKFHCTRPNSEWEKHYNFYTLHYCGAPGGPLWPKFTNLWSWVVMYNKATSINLPNFIPFWQPLYEIPATKLRRLRWQHDPQKHRQNSKQYSLCIPCGDPQLNMIAISLKVSNILAGLFSQNLGHRHR